MSYEYERMVTDAADRWFEYASGLSAMGILPAWYLYYRPGELRLVPAMDEAPDGYELGDPQGWRVSNCDRETVRARIWPAARRLPCLSGSGDAFVVPRKDRPLADVLRDKRYATADPGASPGRGGPSGQEGPGGSP